MLTLLLSLRDCFRARAFLQAEILALRHQLLVLQRSNRGHKLRLGWADRVLWVWLSRLWNDWRSALLLVKPETVIAWHRQGFRLYWRWKSRCGEGRPTVSPEVRNLIRHMSLAKDLVSADFFIVPTIAFQLLFVFVILDQDRRRPIHFAVTANPTAEWTARQLLEAFPWDNAPRYLLRDRDRVYGEKFCETAKSMGIREVLAAPRSPWQNPFAERLLGSIRRECLDHVIVFRVAPDSEGLFRILRKMPYASVARKRCARQPTGRASFARSGDRDSESRRPASPLLAQSCLIEDWPANARVGMQNEPCARLLCEL